MPGKGRDDTEKLAISAIDENGLSVTEPRRTTGDAPGLAEAPQAALHSAAGAPRMVIVEDAPLIAVDLAEAMREIGFDVRATAFTHEQALIEIERIRPEFAIIGMHLGSGEGGEPPGEVLLEQLNAIGCRCLIFSGDEAACKRVIERHPHFAALAKPAKPEALIAEIRKLRDRES